MPLTIPFHRRPLRIWFQEHWNSSFRWHWQPTLIVKTNLYWREMDNKLDVHEPSCEPLSLLFVFVGLKGSSPFLARYRGLMWSSCLSVPLFVRTIAVERINRSPHTTHTTHTHASLLPYSVLPSHGQKISCLIFKRLDFFTQHGHGTDPQSSSRPHIFSRIILIFREILHLDLSNVRLKLHFELGRLDSRLTRIC